MIHMIYDLIVIGGGASGLMAAARAGEKGGKVMLLEKNKYPGVKLMITGKGRCNITNYTTDQRELTAAYGLNGRFLFSAFSRFDVVDTIRFFNSIGVATKIERGNRVFPESDRAVDVRDALLNRLNKFNVNIRLGEEVEKIVSGKGLIEKVVTKKGKEFKARNYLVAIGGKSYPATGSNGEGVRWLRQLGHSINEQKPVLVPIILKEANLCTELEGLSLKNVEISFFQKDKKIISEFGEAVFTANGLSGPIVLDMSRHLKDKGLKGASVLIDFKPALDWKKLDKRVQRDFKEGMNKIYKNILNDLLPQKLIPVMIRLSGIDPEKPVNLITKEERKIILRQIKEFKLSFLKFDSWQKAVATTGGIDLKEVDPKTMRSKIIPNLLFSGEVLDLDGPTGGYNLQVAWSTGYVAGESSVE